MTGDDRGWGCTLMGSTVTGYINTTNMPLHASHCIHMDIQISGPHSCFSRLASLPTSPPLLAELGVVWCSVSLVM